MPSPVKPVIYQLVVRYFGNTNTTNQRNGTLAVNGCGRFVDITPAERALFIEATRPVVEQFETSLGKDLVAEARRAFGSA